MLLEVANRYGLNRAVTFVRSLNGRDDLLGVLRVEPIDVLVFHSIPHNCKQYTTDAENVNPFFYFFYLFFEHFWRDFCWAAGPARDLSSY